MKLSVEYEIGFADAEILEYRKESNELTVFVQAWNETVLRVSFFDVVGLMDLGVGDIADLVIENSGSAFLNNVIQQVYENIPSVHPYTLYQFLNNDDNPAMEVVAAGIIVSRSE